MDTLCDLVKCEQDELLCKRLMNVCLCSHSACTSASLEPSYVLRAIGADEDLAHSSIRYKHWHPHCNPDHNPDNNSDDNVDYSQV